MTKTLAFILLGLAACGDDGGSKTPDAAPVNTMVTVSGIASEISAGGKTPVEGLMISVVKEGDQTPTAMTLSAADGSYTLTFPTGGVAVNGYLHATKGTMYVDSYLYPPAPISADLTGITVYVVTPNTYGLIPTVAQAEQLNGMGFIAAEMIDSANMPVGGAVLTSTPAGTVRYNSGGLPSKTPTSTDTDGIGYVMNVAPGDVMVSATKSGTTFHPHSVNARPDVLTLTLIQ